MELGIITYEHTRDSYQHIKDLGLAFAEFCINIGSGDLYKEFYEKTAQTKQQLEELGLFTGSVGRWGGCKILPDGTICQEELEIDQTLIRAARQLNCGIYVTSGNYVEGLSLFANYSAIIGYFRKLIDFGKEYGVKIAINNCRWNNYICNDAAWSVVHDHLKELYIKYDPSHCFDYGGDYLSEMKKWGSRFAHVHIKGDLAIDGKHFDYPPAGLDQINWGAFMAVLYALGYNGNLSIEPHSQTWKGGLGEKGVRYTIQMMRNLIF
jgi:sugar phosphate isomerase/epimerase